MLCPHCGFKNVEGRKYCRGCAKPLAAAPAAPKPVTSTPAASKLASPKLQPAAPATPTFVSTPAPVITYTANATGSSVHPMAIASLALSFLASILPVGIAAVVMGHVSRSQIAKSKGRHTGNWLAFSGLVISYLQIAFVSLILFSLASALSRMSIAFNRDDLAREAILEQLQLFKRKPHLDAARQRQEAKSALRLIGASESEYFAGRPEKTYSCILYELGWDATRDNELNMLIADSHYSIKIDTCGSPEKPGYAAVAIPSSDSNPANAPTFCIDQTGVLRRYRPDLVNDMNIALLREHLPCPESGEVVE